MGLILAVRRVLRIVVGIIVVVIVAGILLYVFDQNEPGTFTNTIIEIADALVTPFRMLFELDDNNIQIAVNFGIGAVVWLVVAAIVDRLLGLAGNRAAGRESAA